MGMSFLCLFSAIWKISSGNHFSFLHFFFLRKRVLWGRSLCMIIVTTAMKSKSKKHFQNGVWTGSSLQQRSINMPRSETAGSCCNSTLVFWGTSILFSTKAAPICIPIKSVGGFLFLHILSSICYKIYYFYYYTVCIPSTHNTCFWQNWHSEKLSTELWGKTWLWVDYLEPKQVCHQSPTKEIIVTLK